MVHDHSTLHMGRIRRLPLYKKPATYELQKDPGNACALDPPGYPTYFTQSVYTQYGNTPSRGPQMIILGHVVNNSSDWKNGETWDAKTARHNALLRKLYNPLPLEHPRVQAWITALFNHFKHCYYDVSATDRNDRLIVWPVPEYRLQKFVDDPRFSDERRKKEQAAIEQANHDIIAATRKIAIHDNHVAVRHVREIYPDFLMALDTSMPIHRAKGYELSARYERTPSPGNWWGRHSRNFTPEECPGQYGMKHPVNGKWCQMCGWHEEEITQ